MKTWPFTTGETAFRQDVGKLVSGINVFALDFGVQIDSIKQPIKSNSVATGHVSHRLTSVLNNHLDHCFIVFENIDCKALMIDVGQPWIFRLECFFFF